MKHIRTFETGATRDTEDGKPDYEAFLSPQVLIRFGEYMDHHRKQSDGTLRSGDNWQKGIPKSAYMKSMWRHFMDVWVLHRGGQPKSGADIEDALCAMLFNVQGMLHEVLKDKNVLGLQVRAPDRDWEGSCPGLFSATLTRLRLHFTVLRYPCTVCDLIVTEQSWTFTLHEPADFAGYYPDLFLSTDRCP